MSKQKDKNKHSPLKVLKNLIFMIKFSMKYTPKYIIFTLLDMVGRTASTILSVLFTKYIFDAIESGVPFLEALVAILTVAIFNALTELFFLWRYEVYRPQAELSIHEGMQKELDEIRERIAEYEGKHGIEQEKGGSKIDDLIKKVREFFQKGV